LSLGFFGQVNQTMNTTSTSATRTSRYTTHIGWALILLLAACTQAPPRPPPEGARYLPAAFDALPGWSEARHADSLRAFLSGCTRVREASLARACAAAARLPAADDAAARRFFEAAFDAYALESPDGFDGLVTGYYEPLLAGSRTRSALYRFPVHAVPPDLRSRGAAPYLSRGEIDARGAAFRAPVLAWVADPVELFFLHVQGSGQILLPGGERMRVGYADNNGHPYRSLGRYLVDRGELRLEQASMQGIKDWAAANPGKLSEALAANPRYIFFREMATADGPVGALGVPLTAEYSVAVDRRYVPLGTPVYLATTFPLSERPLERLVMAQDVGEAIRGVVRADFYWGSGQVAGEQAGRMRQRGRMWLLWPRGAALPWSG
jgi:membrane-bound lytic murein transglycosylase A